uniref:Mid2 domain-containing protein n=2 Tax=Bionectria ochroleuca TaxID=29856 RepID=A0A0B7JYU9_BIOOC
MSLSLTSTWAAGPVSCFADLGYDGQQVSKMDGTATPVPMGISPNPDCLPPQTGCPVAACATTAGSLLNGRQVSIVTCCPSVDTVSFTCNNDQRGCYTAMTLRNDETGFTTDLGQRERSTEQLVTRAPVTAQEDKALVPGVIVASVAPTSMAKVVRHELTGAPLREEGSSVSSQHTTASSNTEVTESSEAVGTSISTGTIVGISVGIAIPVALVSIGFFVLYRREQQRRERPRIFINNYISNRLSPTELLQLTSQGFHARDDIPYRGSAHSGQPSRPATSADGDR